MSSPEPQNVLQQSLPYLLVFILCSFIVSVTECSQMALKKFKYPFILRYINTMEQILLSLIIPIWRWCKLYNARKENYSHSSINSAENNESLKIIKDYHWFLFYTVCGSLSTSSAGMILNVGLSDITVPTAISLSSFRTIFTLILSVILLSFPLKLWNISAVIVSSLGILLYVLEANDNHNDDGDHRDTVSGILCCLIAQCLFAINDIICKKAANYCYAPNRMVLGNILYTIYTSLVALPLFFWVIWFPKNIFKQNADFSLDFSTCFWIIMTGFCLMGVHVIGYVAISLKSPIFIAMGFLLATPMSFVTDVILHNYMPSYLCVLGAMLLLLGFLMMEIVPPSQILCPFCDRILINKITDWSEDDHDGDSQAKYECNYKIKHNVVGKYANAINSNNLSNPLNRKYNNLNSSGNSSDDIHEPMLSALLQSGENTLPSDLGQHYTNNDLADISFVVGNADKSD